MLLKLTIKETHLVSPPVSHFERAVSSIYNGVAHYQRHSSPPEHRHTLACNTPTRQHHSRKLYRHSNTTKHHRRRLCFRHVAQHVTNFQSRVTKCRRSNRRHPELPRCDLRPSSCRCRGRQATGSCCTGGSSQNWSIH